MPGNFLPSPLPNSPTQKWAVRFLDSFYPARPLVELWRTHQKPQFSISYPLIRQPSSHSGGRRTRKLAMPRPCLEQRRKESCAKERTPLPPWPPSPGESRRHPRPHWVCLGTRLAGLLARGRLSHGTAARYSSIRKPTLWLLLNTRRAPVLDSASLDSRRRRREVA